MGSKLTLRVSTGTKIILKRAEAMEAKAVFRGEGKVARKGFDKRRARIPACANVSPNRAGQEKHSAISSVLSILSSEAKRTDWPLNQSRR